MLVSGRVRGTTVEKGGDLGKSMNHRDESKAFARWLFQIVLFSSLFGEMLQFDLRIFFRRVVQPPIRFSQNF